MATTQDYIEAAVTAIAGGSGGAPTGSLAAFAGTTVPSGWLLCNGANVSRTTYSKLFAVIGTTWGAGDGSTTFTLPNCEGRFLEGTTSTSNVGTYLEAGLPNISGETFNNALNKSGYWAQLGYPGHATGPFFGSNAETKAPFVPGGSYSSSETYSMPKLGFMASRVSSIFGNASTLQPKSAYTLMIIKV